MRVSSLRKEGGRGPRRTWFLTWCVSLVLERRVEEVQGGLVPYLVRVSSLRKEGGRGPRRTWFLRCSVSAALIAGPYHALTQVA